MNDARQVLRAIEECVKTYHEFVKTDGKYSWWQLKSKLWDHPPVVDPRDFDLLEKLTRMLQMVNNKYMSTNYDIYIDEFVLIFIAERVFLEGLDGEEEMLAQQKRDNSTCWRLRSTERNVIQYD